MTTESLSRDFVHVPPCAGPTSCATCVNSRSLVSCWCYNVDALTYEKLRLSLWTSQLQVQTHQRDCSCCDHVLWICCKRQSSTHVRKHTWQRVLNFLDPHVEVFAREFPKSFESTKILLDACARFSTVVIVFDNSVRQCAMFSWLRNWVTRAAFWLYSAVTGWCSACHAYSILDSQLMNILITSRIARQRQGFREPKRTQVTTTWPRVTTSKFNTRPETQGEIRSTRHALHYHVCRLSDPVSFHLEIQMDCAMMCVSHHCHSLCTSDRKQVCICVQTDKWMSQSQQIKKKIKNKNKTLKSKERKKAKKVQHQARK